MNKIIICHGNENDYQYGIGNTVIKAFQNYQENDGENSIEKCKFYESEEIEIEFAIKRKVTAESAARR